MFTSNSSSHLRMGTLKKSSSASEFELRIVEDYPSFFPHSNLPSIPDSDNDNSLDTIIADRLTTYLTSHKSTPPEHSSVLRPRGYSTTASFNHSPDSFEGSLNTSPKADDDLEIFHEDDEEIKTRELPVLKESDFDVSVEMVMKEMIMSSTASVTYPCYVSIKMKEERLIKKPGMDLVLLVDIKENKPLSFLDTLQKLLRFLSENDRLSLFTTQGPLIKRFPFRVMDELTKRELINEFCALQNSSIVKKNSVSLQKTFESALMAIEGRRYKNHIAAVLLLTDNCTEQIDLSHIISRENKLDLPLVYAFSFGQNQNPVMLQELCEHYEGGYYCNTEKRGLYEAMKASLMEMSYIQAKNIDLSLKIFANRENPDTVKIARMYIDKKTVERVTNSFNINRNYFSLKNGINLAFEVELSKADPGSEMTMSSCFVELSFTCHSLGQGSEVHLDFRKEWILKTMPELLCTMPKQIDRKALENYCQIKVDSKLSEALKMASCGNKNQSIQSLMMLKKEIYPFKIFKSQEIHSLMDNIEWFIANLQSQSFRK